MFRRCSDFYRHFPDLVDIIFEDEPITDESKGPIMLIVRIQ
jgi:hypothetical protein